MNQITNDRLAETARGPRPRNFGWLPERPPLGGRYGWHLLLALGALCPQLVLSTSSWFYERAVEHSLGMGPVLFSAAEGVGEAGYACGAVLGAHLVNKHDHRRPFLVTAAFLIVGSAMSALAPDGATFLIGRLLTGSATGVMLIVALPPLTTGFSARRLPTTAAATDVGLFGAMAAGPLVGAAIGAGLGWRWAFAVCALVMAVSIIVGLFAFPLGAAADPNQRRDDPAFLLAAAATFVPFLGLAALPATGFASPLVLAPLAVGVVSLVTLVSVQYRKQQPLMPVRMLSSALPVGGTIASMLGGGASVASLELGFMVLTELHHQSLTTAGLVLAPVLPGVAVAALLFRRAFTSRYLPVLILTGLLALAAGGACMALRSDAAMSAGAAILGFGAGAAVSPGLYVAALGAPSALVGQAFALVELLRGVASYLIAPVLAEVAVMQLRAGGAGLRLTTLVPPVVAAMGAVAVVIVFVVSGSWLAEPDLDGWLTQGVKALPSPPLAGRLR